MSPDRYQGVGTPVHGDVQDPPALEPAMVGCQAAYYMVHSLQDADFERKDAAGARAFGEAAARSVLSRIVYLGGCTGGRGWAPEEDSGGIWAHNEAVGTCAAVFRVLPGGVIFEGTFEIQRMLIGRTVTGLDVR
jgi:alkylation response protein AidB-like acyl-CoA dehydrogenase